MKLRRWGCFLGAAFVAAAGGPAGASEGPRQEPRLEASAFHQSVTSDYGDWNGLQLRAVVPAGLRDVWYADVVGQEAFHDRGIYAAAANTHVWSERWYTQAGLGSGTGDFFFPRLRADASVYRKWLDAGRLVTRLGVAYVRARDEHRDRGGSASVLVYAAQWLTAEVGGRLNWSEPGTVRSERGFAVVSAGREGSRQVTVRLEAGTEGYQQTGAATAIVDFHSAEGSIAWREWLGPRGGLLAEATVYDNPFYTRRGVLLGGFYVW